MDNVASREAAFFDRYWQSVDIISIPEKLQIPGVDLQNKKILLCSCGHGNEPVMAVNAGAIAYAFDISPLAVQKAQEMAQANGVKIQADVMDFHKLDYPDNFFDVIYGSMILHHVDCNQAGREIYRCLKPGGVAYFQENSDANPLLRLIRRLAFGKPGGHQKQKFLWFRRSGTTDEYPVTANEIHVLSEIFSGQIECRHPEFVFLWMFAYVLHRGYDLAKRADGVIAAVFPWIKRYSYMQEIWLRKATAERCRP